MSDHVEVTLLFEPPVEAVDMRDRFQALAADQDAAVEDESERGQRRARCDGGVEEFPSLHVGDHVQDRSDPGVTMVVAELPPHEAGEYRLDGTAKTVADVNPDYPDDDDVVEIVYPERTTAAIGNLKRYAFPRSRLECVAAIHDDETGGEGSE